MVEIFRFIGYFLERCERENSRIFWFVAILLALTFSSFADRSLIRFQTTQTPEVIEKNVKNVLAINSGGDGTLPSQSFIPSDPTARKGASNCGNDRLHDYNPRPRFPWGIGSSPSGNGSGGGSAGGSFDDNKIPPKSEWETDPTCWDKDEAQEGTCSTSEEEKEIQPPGKLQVDIDFPYKYDANANPTLLVPNIGRARNKRA